MKDINWQQFRSIDRNLLASFWVNMRLNDKLDSFLDSKNIIYHIHDKDHNPCMFWENTQFLIRSVCGERESLMGELFNKLNQKISLHFDCSVSPNYSLNIDYVEGDRLFVKVRFQDAFDDSNIYSTFNSNNNSFEEYVKKGYENAENKLTTTNVDNVKKAIEKTIGKIWNVLEPKIKSKENEEHVQHLLKVALSYCYPTTKFHQKKFSAIVHGLYPMENTGKELSCLGAFLLWKQNTDLSSFLDPPQSKQGYESHMEFLSLEKYIAKAGANELTNQMVALTRKASIKSVVSAIMSRNMSHNLGSHYLTNTKNYFRNQVDKIIATQHQLSKEIATDYRGNARLLQYIQERMDFIATIISGDQYPLGGLNFKAEFFDILTNDDCGARHTSSKADKNEKNFLLQYLLYSEHLTRKYDFAEDNSGFREVELRVNYGGEVYTGKSGKDSNSEDIKIKEQGIKNNLSQLRLAVPGGVMARHALFTIVENILRNSAKHNKLDDNKNLVLTIKIIEEDSKYKLLLYDNCGSANRLEEVVKKDKDGNELKDENGTKQYEEKAVKEIISNKLKNLTIVGKDGNIDKNDKGLKEILISTLWLNNEKLSERLYDIQYSEEELPLEVLSVNDNGEEVDDNMDGNLCYAISLDKWEEKKELIKTSANQIVIPKDDFLKIHADFVIADDDYDLSIEENPDVKKKLSEVFPRFIKKSEKEAKISNLIDRYNIVIENPLKEITECLPNGVYDRNNAEWRNEYNNIVFFDHLMNADKQKDWDSDEFKKAKYVDSISGENFTATLTQAALLKEDIFRYKVIDSALARIAIVDERIWGDYHVLEKQSQEEKENMVNYDEVLNKEYNSDRPLVDFDNDIIKIDKEFAQKVKEIKNKLLEKDHNIGDDELIRKMKEFIQNSVQTKQYANKKLALLEKKRIGVYTIDDDCNIINLGEEKVESAVQCRFVSIHLGLLDKLPKGTDIVKFINDNFQKDNESDRIFISIHSGRGNFSPELDEKLKDYPFISLSALDSAFNNSKFLLSELLNNTKYYGKGNLNH